MAIPRYPEGLPLPLRDGYALGKFEQIRSTDMDAGRGVQRWEFEDAPEFPTVSWIFTESESRLFNAWRKQVAKAGWFTIRLLTDMGFDDVTARFRTSPREAELVGRYCWKWSATLEIEFEQLLEEGWAEILPDYVLMADIFDYAVNRKWPDSPYQTNMGAFDNAVNEQWPDA